MTFTSLSEAIRTCFNADASKADIRSMAGGDINEAALLSLADERRFFVKLNRANRLSFFKTEQTGIAALASTQAISVPQVFAVGTDGGRAFLIEAYLPSGKRQPDFFESFGRRLAAMHRADSTAFVPCGRFGFTEDNYIGASPQDNTPAAGWISFFREHRLAPQLAMAKNKLGANDLRAAEWLVEHLEDFLIEPEQPSLLHGDLWGGNYMTGPDGAAWLIDPAAYVGHREADLAMTQLFSGFSPAFYDAYQEAWPLQPGYAARRDLYNLYHMLNHLNLFGSAYLPSVRRILAEYVR